MTGVWSLLFLGLAMTHLPSCPPWLHRFVLIGFIATMRTLTSVGPLHLIGWRCRLVCSLKAATSALGPGSFIRSDPGSCHPPAHPRLIVQQFSLLTSFELPTIPPPTTTPPFRHDRFITLLHRRGLTASISLGDPAGREISRRAVKGSNIPSSLPDRLGRIEFACATDWSFTSGCSPPFFTETQLPLSVTGR